MLIISTNKLHFLAQQRLYKSFSFKKMNNYPETLGSSPLISFDQKLSASYLLNPCLPATPLRVFSKCHVLAAQGSFLLLGTGRKHTQLQPKFKVIFGGTCTGLISKDILFGTLGHKFITFLRPNKLMAVLSLFQYYAPKPRLFLGGSGEFLSFTWSTLVNWELGKLFFYSTLFPLLSSSLQKKVNFVQFNAFLKNARWPFSVN